LHIDKPYKFAVFQFESEQISMPQDASWVCLRNSALLVIGLW